MKKMIKFLKAFSLVELMISLIVISLISAAFAPVITKKLSRGLIAVGADGAKGDKGDKGEGGTGGNSSNCPVDTTCASGYYLDGTCKCQPCSDPNCTVCSSANQCTVCNSDYERDGNGGCVSIACSTSNGKPTKGCCESVGAIYLPASATGDKDLCMLKYNAGDYRFPLGEEKFYHPEYPKIGVQITTVNSTCKKKGFCCWQGNTGTAGAINSQEYGSANRTVCEVEAAKAICSNWGYKNTKIGSWRLITAAEAKKLATAINNDKNDANIANNITRYKPITNGNGIINDSGLQLCDNSSDSLGSNKCAGKSSCTGGDSGGESSTLCAPYAIMSQTATTPVILDNGKARNDGWGNKHFGSVRCVTEKVENQIGAITNGETQTYDAHEPRYQADCPDRTLFINKKYTGTYNLCVMQYNAVDDMYPLDDGTYYHPDYKALGVSITTVNTTGGCKDKTKCCWTGATSATSGASTTKYSNYPSNKRAVCTLGAAKEICGNWDYNAAKNSSFKKQVWRVMTLAEANTIGAYITADGYGEGGVFSFLSKYLNSTGLQLCDKKSDAYGANLCADTSTCKGGDSGGGSSTLCSPACVLTTTYNRPLGLVNGKADASSSTNLCDWGVGHYGSVRCVSNEVRNISN